MYTISKEYEDFLGNQRKEDFRFNLTKSEILNFYTSENGDLRTILINMLQHQDSAKMMKLMSQLIDISYGEISPDGRRVLKFLIISRQQMLTQIFTLSYQPILKSLRNSFLVLCLRNLLLTLMVRYLRMYYRHYHHLIEKL